MTSIAQPQSKVVASILALFLGCLGIHNFYLGYTRRGIIEMVKFLAGTIRILS
uniref:TM2 domain-containing protein n=1 Tax=Vaginimicrobium propionicum TaxID=1871034 RepID=UPI0009F8CB00|nr:TM2 domain-containing protein [Vaginimicrobium propionicum]